MLGAGAMLGGMCRLTLPVVVMLTEMTGDATYMIPCVFCTFFSKLIADLMSPPMYPQLMALSGLPVLTEASAPKTGLTAKDFMVECNMRTLRRVERLGSLIELLEDTKSLVFPCESDTGRFIGSISRTAVIFAMNNLETHTTPEGAKLWTPQSSVSAEFFTNMRTLTRRALIAESDQEAGNRKSMDSYVNLSPLIDQGVFAASKLTRAKVVYNFFRKMGSSHMFVTDTHNRVVGLITRAQLIKGKKPSAPRSSASATWGRMPSTEEFQKSLVPSELGQHDDPSTKEGSGEDSDSNSGMRERSNSVETIMRMYTDSLGGADDFATVEMQDMSMNGSSKLDSADLLSGMSDRSYAQP